MVEESSAGRRQHRPVRTSFQQLYADLVFEIADLTAERRLRHVQPLLSGKRKASGFGDRDEITKMTKLHGRLPALPRRYGAKATKYYASAPDRGFVTTSGLRLCFVGQGANPG